MIRDVEWFDLNTCFKIFLMFQNSLVNVHFWWWNNRNISIVQHTINLCHYLPTSVGGKLIFKGIVLWLSWITWGHTTGSGYNILTLLEIEMFISSVFWSLHGSNPQQVFNNSCLNSAILDQIQWLKWTSLMTTPGWTFVLGKLTVYSRPQDRLWRRNLEHCLLMYFSDKLLHSIIHWDGWL